ncbi:MAG: sigma-70 family RNA polymerase sigma factor [Planctomycetaceae bacterium]|nr:sigma-70 family RNA polymerase sigma factor [Planctomycetales bacterium]MCB9927497.1 sigma-70 family RNA polymerase sigma factor [Planctomycetaceae bacterium]
MSSTSDLEDGSNVSTPEAIFAQYSKKLVDLAQRNLSARLRGRIDGDDIAQSVFRTFFRRSELGEFQIDASADLWKLLVKITLIKVHNQARRHQAEKRSLEREQTPAEDRNTEFFVSREPDPTDAATLVDQLEQLLTGLPESHREIFGMVVQGYSRTEAAEKLKVSRMTVHRVLDLLRTKLERLQAE